MILKKEKLAEIQLYVLTTVVLALTTPAFAQEEQGRKGHAEHRAAFEACLTELGIEKPAPGERPKAPSEEERTKMDDCLKAKGFEPPKFRGGRAGGPHGPPPDEASNEGGIR